MLTSECLWPFPSLSVERFLQDVWEKDIALGESPGLAEAYSEWTSEAWRETFPRLGNLILSDFFLFRDGFACKQDVYTDTSQRIAWEHVERLYDEENCTVYIRNLEKYDRNVARLANIFATPFSGYSAIVNLFITPPSSIGLPVHFDMTNFFVVQISGVKKWACWQRPPSDQITLSRQENAELAHHVSEQHSPIFNYTLRTGEVLYVPIFTIHAPESLEVPSSHFTIGLISQSPPSLADR